MNVPTETITTAQLMTIPVMTMAIYILVSVLKMTWEPLPVRPVALAVAIVLSLIVWYYTTSEVNVMTATLAVISGATAALAAMGFSYVLPPPSSSPVAGTSLEKDTPQAARRSAWRQW